MFDAFAKGHFKALVGLKFEGMAESFLDYVRDFSQRTEASLRLVHAVGYGAEYSWVPTYYGEPYFKPVMRAAQAEERRRMQQRLEQFKHRLAGRGEPETRVSFGSPEEVLMGDALATNCSLIVVGTSRRSTNIAPFGFSTSLSLMAHANCPVMAVPEDVQALDTSRNWRILYADDLADRSRGALNVALEMSYGFGKVDFHHVHFCDSSESKVAQAGDKILELMNASTIPFDENVLKYDFLEQTKIRIKEKMDTRLGSAKAMFGMSDCLYHQHVFFGDDTRSQLAECVDRLNPDILVFGRHSTLHRKPLAVGKLPFSAMVCHRKPVVVAPDLQTLLG